MEVTDKSFTLLTTNLRVNQDSTHQGSKRLSGGKRKAHITKCTA